MIWFPCLGFVFSYGNPNQGRMHEEFIMLCVHALSSLPQASFYRLKRKLRDASFLLNRYKEKLELYPFFMSWLKKS
jgi:hypothetical protein